jgi:hypothetical protein
VDFSPDMSMQKFSYKYILSFPFLSPSLFLRRRREGGWGREKEYY